jgi:hypothetical protein
MPVIGDVGSRPAGLVTSPSARAVRFRTRPIRASTYVSAMAITEDASMNGPADFLGVAEKGEMIMFTKSKIAALAAVAIVIAAPAFADQRVKPTHHSAFAGAFASSANSGGAT